jgi:hypothetical protein
MSRFFDFSNIYFRDSYYVCVVRNPIAVIASNLEKFSCGAVDDKAVSDVITSQLQTYQLIVSMASTLPNVYFLNHDYVDENTFSVLSSYIGCDLNCAHELYDNNREVEYENIRNSIKDNPDMNVINSAFSIITRIFDANSLKLKDAYLARRFLYHTNNEIKRRVGEESVERFGIAALIDELQSLSKAGNS